MVFRRNVPRWARVFDDDDDAVTGRRADTPPVDMTQFWSSLAY